MIILSNLTGFFKSLEATILWLSGVKQSVNDSTYFNAEKLFYEALLMIDSSFSLNDSSFIASDTLFLYILTSLGANRARHSNIEKLEEINRKIIHSLENRKINDTYIYLTALNNLSSVFLEKKDYPSVITFSQKGLNYLEKHHNDEMYFEFKLLYEVAFYLNSKSTDLTQIENAVNYFKINEKRCIYEEIIRNLDDKFGINMRI